MLRLHIISLLAASILVGVNIVPGAAEPVAPDVIGSTPGIDQLRGSNTVRLDADHWIIRGELPAMTRTYSHRSDDQTCDEENSNCPGLSNTALRTQYDNDVQEILGLRGAVIEAELASAQLRASIADNDAANARVWREIAQFAPTITGSISANRYSNNYSASADNSKSYGDIKVSLPIFTSGRRYFGVKSARSSASATMYEGLAAGDDLKQRTINAYLKYYYARSSRALFLRNLKDLKRLKHTTIKRRDAGFASTADIFQIKADIASLQLEVINAGKIMAQSKTELESLAGRSVVVPTRLPNIRHLVDNDRLAMVRYALNNNPKLLAASFNADAADYTSKATFGKYLPQINLSGEYRKDFSYSPGENPNSWSIGVKLTMPLVDFSTVAEISESKSRAQAAYYRSLDTRRQIELQTNTLWQEHVSNNKRAKLANNKVRALQRVVRSRLAQFNQGLIPIDPVLEQKRLLALAEMAAIQIKTEQFFATSQLLITAGIFNASMLNG